MQGQQRDQVRASGNDERPNVAVRPLQYVLTNSVGNQQTMISTRSICSEPGAEVINNAEPRMRLTGRRSTLGDFILYYNSALHDELDTLKLSDISKRVACDRNDVREFACFD